MAPAGRTHSVAWISSAIAVAVLTAACVTWVIAQRHPKQEKDLPDNTFNCLVSDNIFIVPNSTAHLLLKVVNADEDGRLRWNEEWEASNILLEENKAWISVAKNGTYLIYAKVTYNLKIPDGNSTVDLRLLVDFNHAEGTQEIVGAFNSRQVDAAPRDADLTAFFLLRMIEGNRLSVRAFPENRVKLDDTLPFSTFMTVVRYAD